MFIVDIDIYKIGFRKDFIFGICILHGSMFYEQKMFGKCQTVNNTGSYNT